MFKYCVWYSLKPQHIIHKQISLYAKAFGTASFPAHITIRHTLEYEEAERVFKHFKMMNNLYSFSPSGKPKMTYAKIDDNDFYSIEQPVCINDVGVKDLHLSLAYRIGKEFSPAELAIVSEIPSIKKEDIYISLADCSSDDPQQWNILSI
tara:strand:- start:1016 stop:1465 length:450 start_codon:yes stop_codon:yes gene_type:complete